MTIKKTDLNVMNSSLFVFITILSPDLDKNLNLCTNAQWGKSYGSRWQKIYLHV